MPSKLKTPPQQEENEDEGGEEKPDYATQESVHKAIGGRLDAFRKSFMKDMEGLLSPLVARVAELGDKPGEKQTEKQAVGESEEVSKLRKKVDGYEKRALEIEDERSKEKAAAMSRAREALVSDALSKVGISNPTVAKAAASLLLPLVATADDGRIVAKRTNKYGIDEEIAVEDYVKDWSKTDDGKAFIPAKEVRSPGRVPGGGGGARTGTQARTSNDPQAEKQAKIADAREVLREGLFAGIDTSAND